MLRKMTGMFMAALLLNAAVFAQAASAQTKAGGDVRAQEVKAAIRRLGAGEDARVEVRLRGERKLRGYVSEAGADYFVVEGSDAGGQTLVDYRDVTHVKGNNLSTGAKVAIGAGVAAAAIIAFIKWAGQFK